MHNQVDVLGAASYGKSLDAKRLFSGRPAPPWIHLRNIPPNHNANQLIVGEVVHQSGSGIFTIAQHRYPVADFADFLQAVGDENDRNALRAAFP